MRTWGLSPRVRGNPASASGSMVTVGSIPACAGEPPKPTYIITWSGVYPRVCGGTVVNLRHAPPPLGLSPRVRGNPIKEFGFDTLPGSIPACAGEPTSANRHRSYLPVYPRVCGGTGLPCPTRTWAGGLSPRVRGNLVIYGAPWYGMRSIPACAGEPQPIFHASSESAVYPRVCGGTDPGTRKTGVAVGLSPRVRGNPPRAMATPGG